MNREHAPLGIWNCKIGLAGPSLASGQDLPMREGIQGVYEELTGHEPHFIFSGWRGTLTTGELKVLTDKQREAYHAQQEIITEAFPHFEQMLDLELAAKRALRFLTDFHSDNQREVIEELREALGE